MKFKYILLDLDGTLTNPAEGIAKSINYAMEKMGKPIIPGDMIPKFIGPPLTDGFMQNLGFTAEEAAEALAGYRERYTDIGLYENFMIDGAYELLEKLSAAGKTVALATSKPEDMVIHLLEHYRITKYFTFVSAAELDPKGRNNKTDIILHALKNLGISGEELTQTIMTGDRFHDIEGARNAGISSLAVLSGFGSREEFIKYKADFIAKDLFEATDIILGE